MLLLLSFALGAEPVGTVLDDHTVVVKHTISASVEELKALAFDPPAIEAISGAGTQITLTAAGECKEVDHVYKTFLATVLYTTKLCPTAKGLKHTLIKSESFSEYEAEWVFADAGGGKTDVEYRIRSLISLPFPQSMVDKKTKVAVAGMLTKLGAHFAAKP